MERQNRKLSEGVNPSFCDLAERFMSPKIGHGVSKMRLFQKAKFLRDDEFHNVEGEFVCL